MFNKTTESDAATDQWQSAYDDEDVGFYLRVRSSEADLVERCLSRLRRAFPRSPLFLVSDGDYRTDWSHFSRAFDAEIWVSPRLYGPRNGGRIVSFQLDLWRQIGTRWFFKIDPDTAIWRRPLQLPKGTGLWGTLQKAGDLTSIQGGCVLHAGIEAFDAVAHHLANRELVTNPAGTWAVSEPIMELLKRGRVCDDWLRGWAASKAGISQRNHPEILSHWRVEPKPSPDLAITHPHK